MQIYLTIIFFFLVTACSPSDTYKKFNLTKDEHAFLEKFFRYFMLRENAIYTLTGSKPLTSLQLIYYDIPEEQRREEERQERFHFLLNRSNKKDMEFYKKLFPIEKEEKAYLIQEKDFIYPIEDLWDKWENIQRRFPLKKRFLLVKKQVPEETRKESSPGCKAFYQILFIDVLKTALALQENYELFRRAVKFDFDPMEIVLELENEHSNFWDTIRGKDAWRYAHLWGILYGFGRENSFSFCWKSRHIRGLHRNEKEKFFALNLQKWSSCPNRPRVDEKDAFSIHNFAIPAFASFLENDPVVAKYEAEREKIKQLYKGKDFVTFTLELLTDLEPQTELPFRLEPLAF